MSKIALEGNASGTGTFTIASPNSNSNYTLTLPTETGTVLTNSGNQTGVFSALTVNSNNISADNSLGFRNRIINGAMVIDQRNAGASVGTGSGSSVYTLDRWQAYYNQVNKFTIQQNAGSVTPPAGFKNYLGVTSSSAYTVGAAEEFSINQFPEGFNWYDLDWGTANAKTVTLSFWVRSSLTGTFGGAIRNYAGNRSYPFTYTISAANTWEFKTVTIAGDTSGTWVGATNAGAAIIGFGLGVGSSISGTAGAWAGANYPSATGATSVVGTNGATLYITGVQLEVGSTATPFERRPYGTELMLCQRYYQRNFNPAGGGYVTNSNSFVAFLKTVVSMRAAPTISQISGSTVTYDLFAIGSGTISSPSTGNATVNGFRIWGGGSIGATYGTPGHLDTDCFQASSEL